MGDVGVFPVVRAVAQVGRPDRRTTPAKLASVEPSQLTGLCQIPLLEMGPVFLHDSSRELPGSGHRQHVAGLHGEEWVLDLNTIPERGAPLESNDCVTGQVGARPLKFFKDMVSWLVGRPRDELDFRYRIAPSLTTRSECELLGLSSPRFGLRAKVALKNGPGNLPTDPCFFPAFFNLRRMQWLKNSIQSTHHADMSQISEYALVAEAMLGELPARTEGFHRLTCDLVGAYGEQFDAIHGVAGAAGLPSAHREGTPFMQHTDVGGGMCAQACLQMAICLQHQHARLIPSVAELTALAKFGNEPGNRVDRIQLRGLESWEMLNVLRHSMIGLNGCIETADDSSLHFLGAHVAGERSGTSEPVPPISYALAQYLKSRVPVIAIVKLAKLAGIGNRQGEPEAIYRTNAIPWTVANHESSASRGNHAVLLVGCRRVENDYEFLINDPATFPFLRGTGRQLLASRAAKKKELQFIAVLPQEVRLPLVGKIPRDPKTDDPPSSVAHLPLVSKISRDPNGHKTEPATVLRLAYLKQQETPWAIISCPKSWSWPGNFLLVDWLSPERDKALETALFGLLPPADRRQMVSRLLREVACVNPNEPTAADKRGRWKWIQLLGSPPESTSLVTGQIWIWNAEIDPAAGSWSILAGMAMEGCYKWGGGCFSLAPRASVGGVP